MVDWIKGLIIPTVEVTLIGGIMIAVGFFVFKGFLNAWNRSAKFFFKYKVMRKGYPETTVKWIMECMDKGIGFYDAKKMLFVSMIPENQINETMFIYDEIIKTMGNKRNKLEGKNVKQDLPSM